MLVFQKICRTYLMDDVSQGDLIYGLPNRESNWISSLNLFLYDLTSKNEHDWTTVKYLNVLHHNKTQKHCDTKKFNYTCKILFIIILLKNFMANFLLEIL